MTDRARFDRFAMDGNPPRTPYNLHRPMRRRQRPVQIDWMYFFIAVLVLAVAALMFGLAVVRFGLGGGM